VASSRCAFTNPTIDIRFGLPVAGKSL